MPTLHQPHQLPELIEPVGLIEDHARAAANTVPVER